MKLNLFLSLLLLGVTACNSQNIDSASPPHPSQSSPSANSGSGVAGVSVIPVEAAKPKSLPASPSTTIAKPVAKTGNVALVWNGPGACADGCAQGAADSAAMAGLAIRYVNDQTPMTSVDDIRAVFSDARVWVMPGGKSTIEVAAMSPELILGLRTFISEGGGYVGFCAGAFSATERVGTSGQPGLGIFPGQTELYVTQNEQNEYGASFEKLNWNKSEHSFYFEGGPFLKNLPDGVETVAFYEDQSIAAARTNFGNGRVYITGSHPEAPSWWWNSSSLKDRDGQDQSYAADMIQWAASL